MEAVGSAVLKWLADLNYGAVFAASLFPYLLFLRNIWPKDYPIPKVGTFNVHDVFREQTVRQQPACPNLTNTKQTPTNRR